MKTILLYLLIGMLVVVFDGAIAHNLTTNCPRVNRYLLDAAFGMLLGWILGRIET
jgi:hypothetical protein